MIKKFIFYREKVEEMKIIQKLRERPNGVNVVGLALGENVTSDIITVSKINEVINEIIILNIENNYFLLYLNNHLC